ncbi:MAG: ModE family transcriptional regulator [Methylocystaceae bacterium]|nr:MAG: ModE family transcriptional regulator [Methylocystaceae bacterium]
MPRAQTVTPSVGIILRLPNGGVLAPPDLELIDAVRKERSIIGASRALGLSYRKCWLSVDALNRTFESPVVATFPGRREGGAEITPFGERLVGVYRSIERHAANAAKRTLDEIIGSLNWSFQAKASDGDVEPSLDRAAGH